MLNPFVTKLILLIHIQATYKKTISDISETYDGDRYRKSLHISVTIW